MPEVSLKRAFRVAVQHQQAGQYAEAAGVYAEILRAKPNDPDALHLMGVLMHQMGDVNSALQLITQAISENPRVADYFGNLGTVLMAKQMTDDAIIAFRQAIALKSDYPEAYRNLGTALLSQGKTSEAVDAYRWSMALRPGHAPTYANLGLALQMLGEYEESIDACRQALAIKPDDAEVHNYLGTSLMLSGQLEEAKAEFRQVTALRPEFADGWGNLGAVSHKQRRTEEAIVFFRKAQTLRPDDARWPAQLGAALLTQGLLEEALATLKLSLELDPQSTDTLIAIGNVLRDKGDVNGALESYREALAIDPLNSVTNSNLLFSVHAHPDYDAKAILREHEKWAAAVAAPLNGAIQVHGNDRTPGRRLRVGYVSPDFYDHSVGKNILPLLKAHDHKGFEIFCYSGVVQPDETTARIRALADCWRDALSLNDEKLAEMIRKDRIDILVDLSMHTGGNRLLAFARKPAPVQLSYLGFCTTTGLPTMDYRMSDPYIDPAESDLSCYTEKTYRLPRTFWTYNPDAIASVSALPAIALGKITFASMNSFSKITPQALDLWARILLAVPNSRLFVHSKAGTHLVDLRKRFEKNSVAPERVEFVQSYPRQHYYEVYNHIDICLDAFPYGGGITTCDSLWMGVPVVGLWGRTAAGRAAGSILSNIGMPELVAKSPEEYIAIATALAADLDKLAQIRAGLRQKMMASPLLDSVGFAREMETAYREMWKTYCNEYSRM